MSASYLELLKEYNAAQSLNRNISTQALTSIVLARCPFAAIVCSSWDAGKLKASYRWRAVPQSLPKLKQTQLDVNRLLLNHAASMLRYLIEDAVKAGGNREDLFAEVYAILGDDTNLQSVG